MLKPARTTSLQLSHAFDAAQPLWQRVPTRTMAGERTFDFMMIIKSFNQLSQHQQKSIVDKMVCILEVYSEWILLADLNWKINLLWVSHAPRPNLTMEIAGLIHSAIPQAKLVSHRFD